MQVKIEYKFAELEGLVIAELTKKFGPPPAGEEWVCKWETYDKQVEITNRKIEITAPIMDNLKASDGTEAF